MKKLIVLFMFFISLLCIINIESYAEDEYSGEMYLELPADNQKDSEQFKIQGWAVATDSKTDLRLYVNDTYIESIHTRCSRADVDKVVSYKYGGTSNTPQAGFSTTLDVSGYAEGEYRITVYQVSRNEKVISKYSKTIRVEQKKYIGTMYIETPENRQECDVSKNSIYVQGWAVSTDSKAALRLYINDTYIQTIHTRNKRADVDSEVSYNYGGTGNTPNAGFYTNLDLRGYAEGEYNITIYQVSRNEQVISQYSRKVRIVTPKYSGTMNIESLQNEQVIELRNTKNIKISGWAVSNDEDAGLRLYINGTFINVDFSRLSRSDVNMLISPGYGGTRTTPYAGFDVDLDVSSYEEGLYNITVYQISKYEEIISVQNIRIMIDNTKTWGIDVSHYNGTIDWDTVKNNGVNFAILKIGEYRESSGRIIPDDHFESYYNSCKAHGIAVGGYFYSYAFDSIEASHEAEACLSLIEGKSFEMPIFFDIEDKVVTNAVNDERTNVESLTDAAITFCEIMNSRGYQGGVYSYRNFFYDYLNMSRLEQYSIWLAHYVRNTDYTGKFDMWQYTSEGSVPGISGNVDLNWCFKRFY